MKTVAPLLTVQPHAVRFYENDKSLAQIVAQFLSDGLAAGDPAIVVATPAHRGAILRALVKSFDVVQLQRSHDLILLDAEETLAIFMTNGEPEAERFREAMTDVIARPVASRSAIETEKNWEDGRGE